MISDLSHLDTRLDQITPPLLAPHWQEPLAPHSVENVGHTAFGGLLIEIKSSSTVPDVRGKE